MNVDREGQEFGKGSPVYQQGLISAGDSELKQLVTKCTVVQLPRVHNVGIVIPPPCTDAVLQELHEGLTCKSLA